MVSNLDRKGEQSRRNDGVKWKNQEGDKDLYIESRYGMTEGNKETEGRNF